MTAPLAAAGKLGLRLRLMLLLACVAIGKLGLRLRAAFSALLVCRLDDADGGGVVADCSSKTLPMREERRDAEWLDDDELRRDDDRLAMRPRARMALPVFYNCVTPEQQTKRMQRVPVTYSIMQSNTIEQSTESAKRIKDSNVV